MNDYAIIPPAPGRLLVAHPGMVDPNFARSVVLLLAHHDQEGTMGLVLNRPRPGSGPENSVISPWLETSPHPRTLFLGGPVQPDGFICIVADPGEPSGVRSIDFMVDEPGHAPSHRMFRGYSGWGPGQLDAEIADGGWIVVECGPSDSFTTDPHTLWRDVLSRQPGPIARLARVPEDPALN